ncbi:MAG: hypothetical protein CME20_12105 [Gemmatimonadetes bacterium]|nr:hypothetical protein [Gemmatimonadota bacterium]
MSRLLPADEEFFAREIDAFLPDRVFDAHTHLWKQSFVPWSIAGGPADVGHAEYLQLMQDIHPNREAGALFIPSVQTDGSGSFTPPNEWVAEASAQSDACRHLFFIRPEDDPEWVRQEVKRLGAHGLKCYHTMAPTQPTWEADIPAYLPEQHVRIAHEEKLVITLHMVKARAVADPSNQHWIRHYCEQYPDMRLILAHSARGFQPAHNLEGLAALSDLDNLYYDTSANCEPIAHQAIIRLCGHHKLMYGTDLPVSHGRGRSLSAADAFLWLYADSPVWGEKHMAIQPVLTGFEHLRSLKWACWSEKLSDAQVEDIFWHNAAELFGVR